jgi:hypothetical protein
MSLARDLLLVTIAHIVRFLKTLAGLVTGKGRQATTNGELLGTDFATNPCQHPGMKKKGNTSITPRRTTVASVKREMKKPRLTESVRNDGKDLITPSTSAQKAHIRRGFSRAEPH